MSNNTSPHQKMENNTNNNNNNMDSNKTDPISSDNPNSSAGVFEVDFETTDDEDMLQTKLLSIHQYYTELLNSALQSQFNYLNEKLEQVQAQQKIQLNNLLNEKQKLIQENEEFNHEIEVQHNLNRTTEKQVSIKQQKYTQQKQENQFLKDLAHQIQQNMKNIQNNNNNNSNNTTETQNNSLNRSLADKNRRIANLQKELADLMNEMENYTKQQQIKEQKQLQHQAENV